MLFDMKECPLLASLALNTTVEHVKALQVLQRHTLKGAGALYSLCTLTTHN